MPLTTRVLVGLVAGLAIGGWASATGSPAALQLAAAAEPVGTLWVNAIRMTVIPMVVSLLVTGIASASSESLGRIGGRAILLFLALVAVSALFTALAAPPLLALLPALDPATLRQGTALAGGATPELPPFRDWLTALVPANPVKAAADGAMLPLIIFTVVSALALTRTGVEHRDVLVRAFRAVAETMFVVVGWILWLAPVGVFSLVLPLAARAGGELAGALGGFLVIQCGLLVVAILALYPAAALIGRMPVRRFARGCAPAQAVAFSTRSSLAALPAMLDGAEHRLGLPTSVTALALPVAVSLFKFGSPVARIGGTLLVARLYGIELGPGRLALVAAALALLSFYSPGIPSGGLFVLAPVYMSLGLPVEGIGLLIALDLLPDMFVTTANVTGQMAVATMLARAPAPAAGPGPERATPGAAA